MSVTRDGADPVPRSGHTGRIPGPTGGTRRTRLDVPGSADLVQVKRILTGGVATSTTVIETLIVPILLLLTLDIVLGQQISRITGHSALYGSVPMVASAQRSIRIIGRRDRVDPGAHQRLARPVVGAARAPRIGSAVADRSPRRVRILLTTVVSPDRRDDIGIPVRAGSARRPGVAVCPGDIRGGVRDAGHGGRFLLGQRC